MPVNPPATRLCSSSPPTVPRRREAPITATDRGLQEARRPAATAAPARARRSAASVAGDSDAGSSTTSASSLARDRSGKAALPEDVEHPAVVAQHLGVQRRDPLLVRALGQVREQHRGQPASLHRVGDRKRDLGPLPVDAEVLRVTDDRGLGHRDQPERVAVVDVDRHDEPGARGRRPHVKNRNQRDRSESAE